jgi:hypothetical protein
MYKRIATIGMCVLILISLLISGCIDTSEDETEANELENEFIRVSTDRDVYTQGEIITIYLENIGDITLNQSHGWEDYKIKNNDGDIVYHQRDVTDATTSIKPGEKVIIYYWKQKDINDTQIAPGTYVVEKEYAGHTDTAEFHVIDLSQGHIQVSTCKDFYQQGENITISLENIGNVTLNQSHGWQDYIIKNNKGDIVVNQMAVTLAFTSISPGEKVTVDIWNQRDINGTQMAPGTYIVEKGYAGYNDTADFIIQ